MDLRINLDDQLIAEIDGRVGEERRSEFISQVVERALDDESRWDAILGAMGSISDHGHEWDPDPAAWVREQRRSDPRRVG
jgi:metal-responsive CopG/Arc/MetJ family transcriptional regulator